MSWPLLSNGSEVFSRGIAHANDSREKNAAKQVAQGAQARCQAISQEEAISQEDKSSPEIPREHIESALCAVDPRIGESERRLFEHVKLMPNSRKVGSI